MRRKGIASVILCGAVLFAAGCSGKNASVGSGGVLSDVQKFIEADGRDYGKNFTAEIGETLKNTFFSLSVDKAVRLSSLAGYAADDGFDFLAVSVSVKNISEKDIPMGLGDFVIRWAEGDDGSDVPYTMDGEDNSYGFTDYPAEFSLEPNERVSGWLYFEVPKDAQNIQLEYLEVYDDEFEGSTYQINLGNPSFFENDKALSDGYLSTIVGNTLHTPDFDVTVSGVTPLSSLEGQTPDDGYSILAANITVQNTSSSDLTIGSADFYILGSSDYIDYSAETTVENGFVADGYFPERVSLSAGESISGMVVFVPSTDVTELSVAYIKTYDDDSYDMYEFFVEGTALV